MAVGGNVLHILLALPAFVLYPPAHAAASKAGVIAAAAGKVEAYAGTIDYSAPAVGQNIKDYKGLLKINETAGSRHVLSPGAECADSEIIETAKDSWAKILLSDESMLDLGSNTRLQYSKTEKETWFRLVSGNFRYTSARAGKETAGFYVSAPGTLFRLQAGEIIVELTNSSEGKTNTRLFCSSCRGLAEITKAAANGVVYKNPQVIRTDSVLTLTGPYGLTHELAVRSMKEETQLPGALPDSLQSAERLVTTAKKIPLPAQPQVPGVGNAILEREQFGAETATGTRQAGPTGRPFRPPVR